MTNVIKYDFTKDNTKSGYLLDHKDSEKAKVTGVYVDNIAAMVEHDNVYLGTKADDGIDDTLLTNMEDINRFCLMWLLIFDPSVIIKEGE